METDVANARGQSAAHGGQSRGANPERVHANVLQHEAAVLWAWLRERELWFVLVLGLALWMLAYQVPYTFHIDFGGDQRTGRRHDVDPFIDRNVGWNKDAEPAGDDWRNPNSPPFRWAFSDAKLRLPGVGVGTWRVSLLAAGPPRATPTDSLWSDGTLTTTVELSRDPRVYQHLFTTGLPGDLALRFSTPRFSTAVDHRPLGFVAFRAVVDSVGPQLPPLSQIGVFALAIALGYGLARRLGAARRWAWLGALLVAVLLAVSLAWWRIPLTSLTYALGPLSLGCYMLGLVLVRVPLFDSRKGSGQAAIRSQAASSSAIVALVVLAFAIRLGGMVHPAIIFSDIGLNANDLLGFESGQVYQHEGLPGELGGGQAPYPPGQYIIAAPLQLLLDPLGNDIGRVEQSKTLLKIVVALLDSLVVGLIWFVLRRRDGSETAALFAAALYVLPPSAFKSFGVGEFANLAGQALAMPLLAALALLGDHLREWRIAALVLALMLLALLGHSGVTVSIGLLLGCLTVVWLVSGRTRHQVLPLVGIGLVAAMLVGLLYHSAFLHLLIEHQPTTQVAALPDKGVIAKLGDQANRVFGETEKPVEPLLAALGMFGLVALILRRRVPDGTPGLWPLLLAWWGSVALSLGLLLVRGQTVRWDLFLYPALCLAAGPLLAALWQRGRAGKATVTLLLAFLLARGLFYWVWLISDQYH